MADTSAELLREAREQNLRLPIRVRSNLCCHAPALRVNLPLLVTVCLPAVLKLNPCPLPHIGQAMLRRCPLTLRRRSLRLVGAELVWVAAVKCLHLRLSPRVPPVC